jgi:hypothetical protein
MMPRQPDRSVSRRAALAGLGASGAALALAARPATAQDATVMATHPIVGVWRLANDPNDPANVAVGAFHADGIHVGVFSDIGTGLWAWRATGDRTAEATGLSHDTAEHNNLGGTVKQWMAIEVDASGNALTAAVFVRVLDPGGTVVLEFNYTATGTRIAVEPMPSLGTPAAATPAP